EKCRYRKVAVARDFPFYHRWRAVCAESLHPGNVGRVVKLAGGGGSPLASSRADCAGSASPSALLLRLSRGDHCPTSGAVASRRDVATSHRTQLGCHQTLAADGRSPAVATFGHR